MSGHPSGFESGWTKRFGCGPKKKKAMTSAAARRQEHSAPAMGHLPRPPRATVQHDVSTAGGGRGLLQVGLWAESPTKEGEPLAVGQPSAEPPRLSGLRHGGRLQMRAVESRTPYRGRSAGARSANGRLQDVAWDATLRALAMDPDRSVAPVRLSASDLLVKVRVRRPAQLLLFAVDASGSMGGALTQYARRMATAALSDAYLKRASVGMLVFRERSAELLVGPTRKVDWLNRALDALPLGGTTPLASALELARRTLQRELARDRGIRPTLILISDGRANVGSVPGHEGMLAEVRKAASALAEMTSVRTLFLDTTEAGKDDRRARALAEWLGAERVPLAGRTAARIDPSALATMALGGWRTR